MVKKIFMHLLISIFFLIICEEFESVIQKDVLLVVFSQGEIGRYSELPEYRIYPFKGCCFGVCFKLQQNLAKRICLP